jgi:hypothetical protein
MSCGLRQTQLVLEIADDQVESAPLGGGAALRSWREVKGRAEASGKRTARPASRVAAGLVTQGPPDQPLRLCCRSGESGSTRPSAFHHRLAVRLFVEP